MDPMQITLISTVFPFPNQGIMFGIERHVSEYALALKRAGHSVTVITTFWNGGQREDEWKGIRILRVPDSYSRFGVVGRQFDWPILSFSRSVIKEKEVLLSSDIIHSIGLIYPGTFFKENKIPYIAHFHHRDKIRRYREILKYPFHFRNEKKWYPLCDAVICLSEDGKKCLIEEYGVDSEKIYVVPHGVDLNVFKPSENPESSSGMLKLLYLGVLEKRKGVIHLLKAFADCPDLRKRAYLEIAGAGSIRKKLESFAIRNGIQNCVKFLGHVDDATVPHLYRACDVFVFPTLQEGFGFPTIEAMASGKPVIASRLPVLEEIMGDTGYFVETGDSESLAKAILHLADNPGLRIAIGMQGRKKAEAIYSWNAIAERMVSLYTYLTDHRSR